MNPMRKSPELLADRLVLEGKKSLEFFRQLTPEQYELLVYADGSAWSVHKILAHFVSAEREFGRLIRDVLTGGGGAPEEFDLDQFNELEVNEKVSGNLTDLLDQYEKHRRSNAQLVADMTAEDLERLGRHPYLGVVPLEEIIKMIYLHNQIHQRDIRRLCMIQNV